MNAPWQSNETLVDLLVKEATEGLTQGEAEILEKLSRPLSVTERASLAKAVTAIWIAGSTSEVEMPSGLRERIVKSAPPRAGSRSSWYHSGAGWWAAAACLVLAVAGWWPRLFGPNEIDPSQQRAALLASGRVLEASWISGPASDQPIRGDVVFDPVSQQGFLRFRGIPPNDPRLAQYQLWIADAGRRHPEPVDGGVFDVPGSHDVIIPFRAKLPVGKPAAFVVTLEQPGGVVLSRQERVMALAKVSPGT